ncbi:hypothetical protein [Pseudogemmobacter sonorensis]|uniref:hypothetical protein n=1 Tax=Pseudogemmobacter sonorensis TaxID=2989681 RepID=UPI0036C3BD7B
MKMPFNPVFTDPAGAVPLDRLLQIYADLNGISVRELTGHAATPEVTRLRNEAIWAVQQFAGGPLADLGRLFGGRSVKAIDHALDAVVIRAAMDQTYAGRLRNQLAAMRTALAPPQTMSDSTKIAAAAGVLADRNLSDADARLAALELLRLGAVPGGTEHSPNQKEA